MQERNDFYNFESCRREFGGHVFGFEKIYAVSRCMLFGIERPVNHKSIMQTSLRLRVRLDFRFSRKDLMQIERRLGM